MKAGSSAGFASIGVLSTAAAMTSIGAASSAGCCTEGAISAATNSGSGNNDRDEASGLGTALSTAAGSKVVSAASVASDTAAGVSADALDATAASAGCGLRSMRYPRERKI